MAKPAMTIRNEASATGGNSRSPTLPTMKLKDHTRRMKPTPSASRAGEDRSDGGTPPRTALAENLAADCELVDTLAARFITDARP